LVHAEFRRFNRRVSQRALKIRIDQFNQSDLRSILIDLGLTAKTQRRKGNVSLRGIFVSRRVTQI